jgi:hypothetical protein
VLKQQSVSVNGVRAAHRHTFHQWKQPHDARSLVIREAEPSFQTPLERLTAQGLINAFVGAVCRITPKQHSFVGLGEAHST